MTYSNYTFLKAYALYYHMHLILTHLNLLKKGVSGIARFLITMTRAWSRLTRRFQCPIRSPSTTKLQSCKRRRKKRLRRSRRKPRVKLHSNSKSIESRMNKQSTPLIFPKDMNYNSPQHSQQD